MKKLSLWLACLALVLACILTLTACEDNGATPADTTPSAGTEVSTEAPTDAPIETDAPESEVDTDAPSDVTDAAETDAGGDVGAGDFDPAYYIVIEDVQDLMDFNTKVNVDGEYYFDMTVVFLNDIDMEGYEWQPLDGLGLDTVTFDGRGHTISNMYINYNEENNTLTEMEIGAGFVGVAHADLYFKNITFDNCKIDAYERHVGCLVGKSWNGAGVYFDNVKVSNFTVNGWMDYNNLTGEGRKIAFRVAGFMGASWGPVNFYQCTAENLVLSGFHNLAGFLGYDASRTVDEYCFEECAVNNAQMTFSYCYADAYTVEMPKKYVSVFYNSANWGDNIDYCIETGNTFSGISFYDYTDENKEYTPSDFRSWSREEANASGT